MLRAFFVIKLKKFENLVRLKSPGQIHQKSPPRYTGDGPYQSINSVSILS
jgi:hypothetical protein